MESSIFTQFQTPIIHHTIYRTGEVTRYSRDCEELIIVMQTHFGIGTLITFFSGMGFRFSSELLRAFTASLTAWGGKIKINYSPQHCAVHHITGMAVNYYDTILLLWKCILYVYNHIIIQMKLISACTSGYEERLTTIREGLGMPICATAFKG